MTHTPLIVVAGATGYLGGHVVAALHAKGFRVRALARDATRLGAIAPLCDEVFVGQATQPETLGGLFDGAAAAFSSIGVRHVKRRPTLWTVDRDANLNLVAAAEAAGVERFVFTSVVGGPRDRAQQPLAEAREQVADRLAQSAMVHTVVRPTGLFNDMAGLFALAQRGRYWMFGDGRPQVNPIHGRDVGEVVAQVLREARPPEGLDLGGPDAFSLRELGELAFDVLGTKPRFGRLPLWVIRALAAAAAPFNPNLGAVLRGVYGASAQGGLAPVHGRRQLRPLFERLAQGVPLSEALAEA